MVRNLPAREEISESQVQYLGREDPLEEEMANHSSILSWKIPGGIWQATVKRGHKESDRTEHSTRHTHIVT